MTPGTKTHRTATATAAVLVAVFGLATMGAARDRPRAPRSFQGSWTLDLYLSDHPEQVARALRLDTGEGGDDITGDMAESADVGRGNVGRGTSGGFGRPGTTRGVSREAISENDRKLLAELTDAVRFPPAALTIVQTDTAVTMATDAGMVTLQTNGKVEKHRLAAGTVDRTATWEGPQLVVRYDVGHAGTLTYTYLLAPTTGQLVVRINFERRRGEPGPFDIKLVYDPAAPAGGAP